MLLRVCDCCGGHQKVKSYLCEECSVIDKEVLVFGSEYRCLHPKAAAAELQKIANKLAAILGAKENKKSNP